MAVSQEGELLVWGAGEFGQLGLGGRRDVSTPQVVSPRAAQRVTMVACGLSHTVIATDDGGVYTAGCGLYGRLGVGDEKDRVQLTLVSELKVCWRSQISCFC